jgi:VWFA-related protein
LPRFVAVLLLLSSLALSQEPVATDQVFRVHVEQVVVDAQILSKKTHRPVQDLTPDDFQLFENGVRQQINAVSQDKLPLSIVFLFDLTDSVRPVLKPLARGALQALEHLKPEDEAAVMVYSSSAQLLQDFTTDHALLVQAIHKAGSMESAEAAFFNEGVFQAAQQARKSTIPGSRRVIIWLTDNIPNIPSEEIRLRYARSLPPETVIHTLRDAMDELTRTGTVVCTLLETSYISDYEFSSRLSDPVYMLQSNLYPPGDVYKYSDQTGGQVIQSSNSKQVSRRLADLIDEIRGRYALMYHPSQAGAKGSLRTLKLKIAPEVEEREGKLIVKTKRGYYR